MIRMMTDGVIPNTQNKKYIIDTASELSQLETLFGNEAYCIDDEKTYICNGSGVYVEKKNVGENELPYVTSEDDNKTLSVIGGVWGASSYFNDFALEVDNKLLRKIFDSPNIYDVDHNTIIVTNQDVPTEDVTSQFRRGTVYLYGYYGDVVVSTKGNQAGYFADLHVYDKTGTEIPGVSFGSLVSSSTGEVRQGLVVSIPQGASYFTFRYRTHTSTKLLVQLPMVTLGNTITNGDYLAYASHYAVTDLVNTESRVRPVYVSTTGSDDNDGWTFDTAVATFTKALRLSNIIYAERGVYTEAITIDGEEGVRILPYDNNDYVAGTPRQMIEINGGEVLTPTASGDNIFTVADYEGGLLFERIYSQDPDNPGPDFIDLISNESKKQYRCNVFVNLHGEGKLKLKPVWTTDDLVDDSFTWNPQTHLLTMKITSAEFGETGDFETVTVIKETVNFRVNNCTDVVFSDLAVKYNYSTAITVTNSNDVTFQNCEASYSATGMGFQFNSTNGILQHCIAQRNGVDGFNFHECGYSEMVDCTAFYNYDDGCSHHSECVGTVNGGEFIGNGKGGMTPAYGVTVDIYNILARGNKYGIAYLSDNDVGANGTVSGCACIGNEYGLKVEANCTVNAIGVRYSGNTSGDKYVSGTLNELGDTAPMMSINYDNLVALRNAGKLVPGMQYRIIDYSTIINGSYDLSVIGAQGYIHYAHSAQNDFFDVIVVADDASHLSENARACRRDGSTYAPDAKPDAWEIKYTLDNDPTKHAWADAQNGKGIIYFMKDEHNNSAGYDFKNIQFIRYALKLADDVPQDFIDVVSTYGWSFQLPYDVNNPWQRYGSVYDIYRALASYMDTGTYENPFKMLWKHNLSHVYDFYVGANILGVIQFPEADDTYLSTFNADWYYTFDVYNNGEHKDGSILETACVNNRIEPCFDMVARLIGSGSTFGLNGSITCGTVIQGNLYIGVDCWTNTISTNNLHPIIIDEESIDNVVAGWRRTTITHSSECNIIDGESDDLFISHHNHAYFLYSSDISLNEGSYCTFAGTHNVSLPALAHDLSFIGCGYIQNAAFEVGNLHAEELRYAVLKGYLNNSLTIPAGLGGNSDHDVIGYSGSSSGTIWFTTKTGYNTEDVLYTTDGGQTWQT